MKLSEVVENIDGKLIDDGRFDTLEYCTSDINVPFLSFLEKSRFINKVSKNVSCILCKEELIDRLPSTVKGIFVTEFPKETFHLIHNSLAKKKEYIGVNRENKIGTNCMISPKSSIAEKNVIIGNNVIIEDNVVISENVEIGNDCVIHSGAILGGKAFTFAGGSDGNILGIEDVGNVFLGNHVEICSMVHIAKGILPTDITYIDDDCKIDAFVHVGHGAYIGKHTMVAAGAVIGGNSKIGDNVWIGINATVSNRIKIGDKSRVNLGAVVTKDVLESESVTGNFAIEHSIFIKKLKESVAQEE